MKRYCIQILFLIGFICYGCSNDAIEEVTDDDDEIAVTPSFTVFGENDTSFFQFDFDGDLLTGETTDLTATLGIPTNIFQTQQVQDQLTLYTFGQGDFSAYKFDPITGANQVFENFYNVSIERTVVWILNSENEFLLVNFSPAGSDTLTTLILPNGGGTEEELLLLENIEASFEPVFRENRLIAPYQDTEGNFGVVIVNVAERRILANFTFDNLMPGIVFNEEGNIVFILTRTGEQSRYEVVDFNSLEVIDEGNFSLNRTFLPGLLEGGQIIANRLFYTNPFAQPAPVDFGPAILDLSNSENQIIDLFPFVRTIEMETQNDLRVTEVMYDSATRNFIVPYSLEPGLDTSNGGVLVISEQEELLQNINLQFRPSFLFR